jgi:hypothetical protein
MHAFVCGVAAVLQWVGYLTWRRQLEMLAGVAAGMAHLHRWGQLRGDLRTSCVFVMPDGKVRCCVNSLSVIFSLRFANMAAAAAY